MCTMFSIRVLIICGLIGFSIGEDNGLTVQTKNGLIKGRVQKRFDGSIYHAWQGIPYAAPPVGKLRFQAPVAPANWSGVKETTKESNICYQLVWNIPTESEDCLYINVFAPANRSSKELPIIFWIYGGAFAVGSANFSTTGPDWLVAEDVIVVTHNHRVGAFGFLSTGDTVVPGNAGLKDQALALKWTHENIAAFGGNPKKIVIAGDSSGAGSVGYHMLHKKNNGLFSGAIQQSGSPLNEWALITKPKEYVISLIQKINASATVGNDSKKQLEFLQSVSAATIDAATPFVTPLLTLPVIEPEHDGAYITKKTYVEIEKGNYIHVPVLMGCTSEEELTLYTSSDYIKQIGQSFDSNPQSLIPRNLVTANEKKAALAKEIKAIYLDENELFANREDAVIRYCSDNNFTRGDIKQGELMSNHVRVYFYIFSYDGELGGWNRTIKGAEKVRHFEDLRYMFVDRRANGNEDLSKFPEADRITSARIVKMWTNFAKELNPTPKKTSLLQNVTWPTVHANNYQYLDINTDLHIKVTPKASYPLWKKAYEGYAVKPYVTY